MGNNLPRALPSRGYRGLDRRRSVPDAGVRSRRLVVAATGTIVLALTAYRATRAVGPVALLPAREVLRVVGVALLVTAAALRHVRWRLTGEARSGLLAALLSADVLATVPLALALGLLHPQLPALVAAAPTRFVAAVVCALTALVVVRVRAVESRLRPCALIGCFVGASLAGGLLPILTRLPTATAVQVAGGLEAAGGLALAGASVAVLTGARAGRAGLALLLALLAGVELARAAAIVGEMAWAVTAGVLLLGAGVVALAEAAADLRSALAFSDDRVVGLSRTLADRVDERDQLRHDAVTAIAALQAASHVLHVQGDDLDPGTRADLSFAVTSELARLAHLIAPPSVLGRTRFALDDVVGPVVATVTSTGLPVRWSPASWMAVGDPRGLATVLHAVLVNARRHAGSGLVDVWVQRTVGAAAGGVEVHVADRGPGVPQRVRSIALDRGCQSPAAAGRGLPAARTLMAAMGGGLELRDRVGGGTEVVLSLLAPAETLTCLPRQLTSAALTAS